MDGIVTVSRHATTHGPAFNSSRDESRLSFQRERIRDYMLKHGTWKTLAEIAVQLNEPEASVSAQLRHLRKERFGGWLVEKRRREDSDGTWEYRVRKP